MGSLYFELKTTGSNVDDVKGIFMGIDLRLNLWRVMVNCCKVFEINLKQKQSGELDEFYLKFISYLQ